MHENVTNHVRCELGQFDWVEGKSFSFRKRGYILKFITIQFDAGAVGDVDVRIENEKGRFLPWQSQGGDSYIRAVGEQPLKFYIGMRLHEHDTFKVLYRNRSSGNEHYVNVFFEFVRGN